MYTLHANTYEGSWFKTHNEVKIHTATAHFTHVKYQSFRGFYLSVLISLHTITPISHTSNANILIDITTIKASASRFRLDNNACWL